MCDMTLNACTRPRISILVLSAAAVLGLVLSPCTLEAQTTDALRSNPTGFVLDAVSTRFNLDVTWHPGG